MVFDLPGLQMPFKERLKRMQEHLSSHPNKYLKLIPYELCTGSDHLKQ
jgi:hypothetical protein